MRGVLLTLALACLLLVVPASAPPQAAAAPGFKFGIQDDAWLGFGPGTVEERVAELQRLGVDVVRVTIEWHQVETARGQYDWEQEDALLNALRHRGLTPLVTIWGTPAWANGGKAPNWAPRDATAMTEFARAAAQRYRFVRQWLIWNEPNQQRWLRPVSPSVYVSRLLNPAYRAIKQVSPGARIGGGVTAPRGGSGGMSPSPSCAAWTARAVASTPTRTIRTRCDPRRHRPPAGARIARPVTLATLERLLTAVGRAFPSARVWLTEYGYQTNPPDRLLGVSPAKQALYLAEAARRVATLPRVDLLVHYLYRDEPSLGRWQSGLTTVTGQAKPALAAAMLPLAQVSRKGSSTVVWGQVRPGSGAQQYVLRFAVVAAGRRSAASAGPHPPARWFRP